MVIRIGASPTAGVGPAFAAVGGGAISVAGAVLVGGGADIVGETDNGTAPVTSLNC